MLAAASVVLLLTSALAFFYGGMTRSKSALNMMMTGLGALAVVGPVWMLWGYSDLRVGLAARSEHHSASEASPLTTQVVVRLRCRVRSRA